MSWHFHPVRGMGDVGLLAGGGAVVPAMYLSLNRARALAMHEAEERRLIESLEREALLPSDERQ